jgi:hypothetical protein
VKSTPSSQQGKIFSKINAQVRAAEDRAALVEKEMFKMLKEYPHFEPMRTVGFGETRPDFNGAFWMQLPK